MFYVLRVYFNTYQLRCIGAFLGNEHELNISVSVSMQSGNKETDWQL